MEHNEVDSGLQAPSTSGTSTYRSTGCGSDTRLVEIFEKEIDREIAERMGAIAEIADNIKKCQQSLDRLRKEAVVKYYMSSYQDLEREEQPSIHPAVKKLIGKRPRNVSQTEQFLTSDLTEWKRETRKKFLKKCSTKHKNKNPQKLKVEELSNNDSLIKPRYVPPNIPGNPQENSSLRGNTKKMHMRVLVGNVAKQIQPDGDIFDPATHKWMVYVRSAPGSLAVDREVARVCFFLHPSYKPHDIITIPNPPFTLNRRGWGEFPMRVQLHFKNRLNKPADIIHHLKLNGARSGHHTRSAETFADLWLYSHERDQENKVDKGSSSEDILWLASDMLKEAVPDFTSEVICSRCQTTSLGTDSHNCTCNIKDSTQDSGSDNSTDESSASSSEESDSSDSEDSDEDSALPKPLPCWEIPFDIDEAKDSQALLNVEIKDEQVSDEEFSNNSSTAGSVSEISYCVFDRKKNGQLLKKNVSEKESYVANIKVKEVGSYLTNPSCFNLESNVNQFVKVGSDILDVEASDIMDALEMRQEVKEESQENVNENFESNKCEYNNLTPKDPNRSTVPSEMDYLSKSKEQRMVVDSDGVDDKITFKNHNAVNSIHVAPEPEINDTTRSSSDLSSLIANPSENSFLDDNMIIEEVPIDEFINNIVEEEVVVEVPEMSTEDVTSREKSETAIDVSETQKVTLLGIQHSLSVENAPLMITKNAPCPKEIVQYNQTSPILSKPIEITPPSKTVSIPSANTLTSPKDLLVKYVLPPTNHPFNTTPKYVKVQSLLLTKGLTDKKDLSTNNQGFIDKKGPLQLSLPCKEVPVKSPRYIQITKEILTNKQVSPNANHILKKPKVEELYQATNIKERNLLASQGSLLLKSSQMNPTQFQPKSETFNNNSEIINSSTKISVDQNNISKENTQNTSLLRPQFRSNAISKINFRNPNPNSLLRPILVKPTITQSNSSNLQIFQKSAKQVLPSSRMLTYSVLKSTVNSASVQPRIKIQNFTMNSVGESICKPIITTQNSSESLVTNQLLPEIHKTINSSQVNRLNSTPSCNQKTTTNKVGFDRYLGQELLKLSNNVYKKCPDPPSLRETDSPENLPEIPNMTHGYFSVKCSAPKSFSRQSYSSISKPSESGVEAKNHLANPQIFKDNLEDQIYPNVMDVVKDTISFNELISVIHFPKTSIPSRPVIFNPGGSDKREVKTLDLDCVLSCNSLHNDLQKTYLLQPESQFGRKSVMISKDQVNSTVNDQVLYYLEQLRLLVNTCKFLETELAVRWLVRGLPLVLPDARLMAYKMIHPYCAVSKEVYCSWPSFKQAAAEWLRAKTVVRLLSALRAKGVLSEAVWSTRKVYWWCRTHGYSPAFCLIGPESPANSNTDCIQKLQQKTSPKKVLEWMASVRHEVKRLPEEDVDVVGIDSQEGELSKHKRWEVSSRGGGGSLICGRPWVQNMHSYVINQVERLGQEPLVAGGPPQSVAATLLSHAVVALAEDMLRRGLANAARRGGGSLEPRDVCRVILRRQEFDIFTGQGLEIDMAFREYLKSPKPP